MYSPQFMEMYSSSVHAERLESAERQRLAYTSEMKLLPRRPHLLENSSTFWKIVAARLRCVVSRKIQVRSSIGG